VWGEARPQKHFDVGPILSSKIAPGVEATVLVVYLSLKWCALRKENSFIGKKCRDTRVLLAFKRVAQRRSGAFQLNSGSVYSISVLKI